MHVEMRVQGRINASLQHGQPASRPAARGREEEWQGKSESRSGLAGGSEPIPTTSETMRPMPHIQLHTKQDGPLVARHLLPQRAKPSIQR